MWCWSMTYDVSMPHIVGVCKRYVAFRSVKEYLFRGAKGEVENGTICRSRRDSSSMESSNASTPGWVARTATSVTFADR